MKRLLCTVWLVNALALGGGCSVIPINLPADDGGSYMPDAAASRDAGLGADSGIYGDTGPVPWNDGGSGSDAGLGDGALDAVSDGLPGDAIGDGGLDWSGEGPVDDATGGDSNAATDAGATDAGTAGDPVSGG